MGKKTRAPRIDHAYEAKSKFYDYVSAPKYWFYQSDPGVKHDNKQCQTCIYRSADQSRQDQLGIRVHCDYISFSRGRRRGCPPSPTCTKYVKGKRLSPEQQFNPKHKAGFSHTIDEPPYARLKSFSK